MPKKKDVHKSWRSFVINRKTIAKPEPLFEDKTEDIERAMNLTGPGRRVGKYIDIPCLELSWENKQKKEDENLYKER